MKPYMCVGMHVGEIDICLEKENRYCIPSWQIYLDLHKIGTRADAHEQTIISHMCKSFFVLYWHMYLKTKLMILFVLSFYSALCLSANKQEKLSLQW